MAKLAQPWWRGNIPFYDPETFSGWPVFQFYAFLAHLVAALLSHPLSLFVTEAARLSVHVILVIGCASFPCFVYYAARPLLTELFAGNESVARRQQWLLALSTGVLSFWFLNHDGQWYGIGAAAVMNIGLYSQLFGWIFFLLHLGALFRFLQQDDPTKTRLISVFFALLLLSHAMTFVYSAFLVFLSCCWFAEKRWVLFRAHLLGVLLTAFWLVPMLWFTANYTALDIYRPTGDFLELFFRYPLYGLLRGLRSWLQGHFTALDPTNIVIMLLCLTLLCHQAFKGSRLLITFMVFNLLGLVVFSSGFIASSLPIGFHYYRFLGYVFLLALLLLSVVPLVFLKDLLGPEQQIHYRLRVVTLAVVAFVCLIAQMKLPHFERGKIAGLNPHSYLASEDRVLDYFSQQSAKGRVIFEYFDNYKRFPFLSCHYMITNLKKRSGFEPINGLFLQSTLAYLFPIGSLNSLGVRTWSGPTVYLEGAKLDDATKIEQLKSFGVTHIVLSNAEAVKRLRPFLLEDPVEIGLYSILHIAQAPYERVAPLKKELLGYLDLKGNLPFKIVSFYFYARQQLYSRFELIEIKKGQTIPKELVGLIANGADSENDLNSLLGPLATVPHWWPTALIRLNYDNPYLLKHYGVWYQHNVELDNYKAAAKFLDQIYRLPNRLLRQIPSRTIAVESSYKPELQWSASFQSFTLSGLERGKMLRLNYSYFPFWHSSDGEIYRGLAERIFFLPNKESAHCSYTKLYSLPAWLGSLLSLIALFFICRQGRQPNAASGGAAELH